MMEEQAVAVRVRFPVDHRDPQRPTVGKLPQLRRAHGDPPPQPAHADENEAGFARILPPDLQRERHGLLKVRRVQRKELDAVIKRVEPARLFLEAAPIRVEAECAADQRRRETDDHPKPPRAPSGKGGVGIGLFWAVAIGSAHVVVAAIVARRPLRQAGE